MPGPWLTLPGCCVASSSGWRTPCRMGPPSTGKASAWWMRCSVPPSATLLLAFIQGKDSELGRLAQYTALVGDPAAPS